MMQKKEYSKIIIFTFLILLVLLALQITAQEPKDPFELTNEEQAYYYGKNLDFFIEKNNPSQQEDFIKKYSEEFKKGVKDSLENEEKKQKIAKLFTEKKDEKAVLSDETKNTIWKALNNEQKSEMLKEIIAQKLSKITNYELLKKRLNNLKFTGKEKWKDNKIGIEINGKFQSWLDADDVHYSLTNIEFNEDKLNLKYDTGNGKKSIILHQGTINKYGEIVDKDGRIVGKPIFDVTSIKFNGNKKEFEMSYKNQKEEIKTLKMNENELYSLLEKISGKESVDELKIKLNDPSFKKIIENLKIDSSLSTNTNNKLNVLYGGNYQNEGIIEIDYDNLGRLQTKISNGGNIVSTNTEGKVIQFYKQFYSKDGIADFNHYYNSGNKDESAEFKFDLNGDVLAAKNGVIDITNIGKIYTSRKDFIGTDIINDNTFYAKILTGQNPLDSFLSLEEINDLQKKIETGKIKSLDLEIAKIIEQKIEKEGAKTTINKAFNNLLGSMQNNIQSKSENILNKFFPQTSNDNKNAPQTTIKTFIEEQTSKIPSMLMKNPEYLPAINNLLSTGNKKIEDSEPNPIPKTSDEYKNKIVIDVEGKSVYTYGNEYITFNSRTDLSKFSASSTRTDSDPKESTINLMSNNHLIAQFDGKNTNVYRIIPNYDYKEINAIINTKNPYTARLSSPNDFYGTKWELSSPSTTITKRNGDTLVLGVPDLGYYYAMDMKQNGEKITITNYAALKEKDPNLQRALDIGAQRGATEGAAEGRRRVSGLQNFITLGIAGRIAERIGTEKGTQIGIDTAYQKFLQSQNPKQISESLGNSIIQGYDNKMQSIYTAWDGKDKYNSFAEQTIKDYDSILPVSAKDGLTSTLKRDEYEKISKFISSNPSPYIEISSTEINIGTKKLPLSEEVGRTFFNEFSKQINGRRCIDYKTGREIPCR